MEKQHLTVDFRGVKLESYNITALEIEDNYYYAFINWFRHAITSMEYKKLNNFLNSY